MSHWGCLTGPLNSVRLEAVRADDKYGPPASASESYGVLMEEVAELLDAIRARDLDQIRLESIQVSAVALRLSVWASDHDGEESIRI